MKNRVEAARVKDLFTTAQLHAPAAGAGPATPVPSPRPAPPPVEAALPPRASTAVAPDAVPDELLPNDVGFVPLESGTGPAEGAAPAASAAAEGQLAPQQSAPPAPPKPERRPTPPQEVKKRRVLGVKGGDLLSQDGSVVRFRKRCMKCGKEDNSVTTMQIPPGFVRVNFFCPKCKKSQQVEVQGLNA
jgi:hypothetical protein